MMFVPSIFGDVVDDFFDDDWSRPVRDAVRVATPGTPIMRTDVRKTDDAYLIDVELPGYDKNDVHVELKDGNLTISASKSENNDEKDKNGHYIRRERYEGSCQRSFRVGNDVKQDDISAKFENGVLKITVNRKQPEVEVEDNHYINID